MTSRLLAVTAWLAAGHAVLFGLFWLLLAVPESNVPMLIISTLVVAAMLIVFGIVEGGGLLAWNPATPARDVLLHAWRAVPGVWLGALLFVFTWYLASLAGASWQEHRGEIDAWLMAQAGWPETGKLHAAAGWFFTFLAWVPGVSLGVSLASAVVHHGLRGTGRPGWILAALSLRRILTVAAVLLLFLWLPWRGVNWRPSWLAPNWQETAFVAVKLGVLFALANAGWALVLAPRYFTSSQRAPLARPDA
jgi:hypothetical protein